MDNRVDRLFQKAEDAADRGDLDQAETYRVLAGHAAYLARKEVQMLAKIPTQGADSE